MTEDIQQGHVQRPSGKPPAPRTVLLWAALIGVVLLIVSFGLSSHRPGVPTVTPGRKGPTAAETALNNLSDNFHALPMVHRKAATRQADASG